MDALLTFSFLSCCICTEVKAGITPAFLSSIGIIKPGLNLYATRTGNNQTVLNCFSSYPSEWKSDPVLAHTDERSEVFCFSRRPWNKSKHAEQECPFQEKLSCFSCVVARKPGSFVILADTRSPLWEVPEAAGKLCLWMDCCHSFNTDSCTGYSTIHHMFKNLEHMVFKMRLEKKRQNRKKTYQ